MAATLKVSRKPTELWKKLIQGKLGGRVYVGIPAGIGSESDGPGEATLAEVALWLHEGTATIPPRPFLTYPLDGRRSEVQDIVKRLVNGVLQEKITDEQALQLLGQWGRNQVVKFINDRKYTPNADSTVAHKGSDTPLVDFGVLKSSITFVIDKLNR